MARIFVTGMEGLIGQGVRDALESLDHTVLGVICAHCARRKNLIYGMPINCVQLWRNCDGVLHLALCHE